MAPFLTILTRTYRRPTMLARCKASLQAQTCKDFEHAIIEDRIGIGIAETYRFFQTLDVDGDYVFVLDDDNMLTDDKFIERVKNAAQNAELIVCKVERDGTVLPSAWPPQHSRIDMMCVVISRRLWYLCRKNFEPKYDGDFSFIEAVLNLRPSVAFLDGVVGKTQAVSHGRPEGFSIVGHRMKVVVSCAGADFACIEGQTEVVRPETAERFESLLRAGYVEDLDSEDAASFEALQAKGKTSMKLLVFCPTYRLEAETVQALVNQSYGGTVDFMFTRDNPFPSKGKDWALNIQHNYEKMRRIVLDERYDKVWVVESDIIPPHDALTKLLAVDAHVVSGLYALRHGEPAPNVMRAADGASLGTCLQWEEVVELWGKTVKMSGGCMGCLLLDARTLEDFSFITGDGRAPDVSFMRHCNENFLQAARLDVVCGHKKPDGSILWPDQEKGWRLEPAKTHHMKTEAT